MNREKKQRNVPYEIKCNDENGNVCPLTYLLKQLKWNERNGEKLARNSGRNKTNFYVLATVTHLFSWQILRQLIYARLKFETQKKSDGHGSGGGYLGMVYEEILKYICVHK